MDHPEAEIKACREEFAELQRQYGRLEQEDWDIQMQMRDLFEAAKQEINELVEGRYSRAVFCFFTERNPRLVRTGDGRTVRWQDVFGKVYEKTTPGQRHDMVGLIEGEGAYRLKYRFRYRFRKPAPLRYED